MKPRLRLNWKHGGHRGHTNCGAWSILIWLITIIGITDVFTTIVVGFNVGVEVFSCPVRSSVWKPVTEIFALRLLTSSFSPMKELSLGLISGGEFFDITTSFSFISPSESSCLAGGISSLAVEVWPSASSCTPSSPQIEFLIDATRKSNVLILGRLTSFIWSFSVWLRLKSYLQTLKFRLWTSEINNKTFL